MADPSPTYGYIPVCFPENSRLDLCRAGGTGGARSRTEHITGGAHSPFAGGAHSPFAGGAHLGHLYPRSRRGNACDYLVAEDGEIIVRLFLFEFFQGIFHSHKLTQKIVCAFFPLAFVYFFPGKIASVSKIIKRYVAELGLSSISKRPIY